MKEECVVIVTFCNDKDIIKKINNTLLESRLCAGIQISEVKSNFWWNNKISEIKEYKLEIETRKSLYSDVVDTINKIHKYDLCGITYYKIEGEKSILDWIIKETRD